MCICFQRQTSFPPGELLHPPRRGAQVPTERRHSYLQLTLGYSEFTASNLHLGKAGQAQPTGNYRVKLPRTAPRFAQLVATGKVTEEPRPQCHPSESSPWHLIPSEAASLELPGRKAMELYDAESAQHPPKARGSRRGRGAAQGHPPSLSCAIPISSKVTC